MAHSDHLDAALIVMVHRLDDPDPGVRAAAVELVRAAAARKGVRRGSFCSGTAWWRRTWA